MAEPSWKVMEEKQDLEFHAQEDNRGGAEMLCHLPVLITLLGLAGQQADSAAPFPGFLRLAFCLLCAFLAAGRAVASPHVAHQEKHLCREPGRCWGGRG